MTSPSLWPSLRVQRCLPGASSGDRGGGHRGRPSIDCHGPWAASFYFVSSRCRPLNALDSGMVFGDLP